MTEEPIPPLSTPITPPPKVYPRVNRRLRRAMWLALVGGPVMIGNGVVQWNRASRLTTEGQKVTGDVVAANEIASPRGNAVYTLTVQYVPAGGDTGFQKEFSVSQAVYQRARASKQAPVTYLPGDPEVSAVGDEIPRETEPFAIGAGLLVFAAGVGLYLKRQEQQVMAYVTGGRAATEGPPDAYGEGDT